MGLIVLSVVAVAMPEIVRNWFAVHPVDWLAVDSERDVVGDAFAEGVRNFAVVDAIIDIRLGSSY